MSTKRVNEEAISVEDEQITKKVKLEEENVDNEKKYPKKKVVLLVAYSGKGYYGMQVCSQTLRSIKNNHMKCIYLNCI